MGWFKKLKKSLRKHSKRILSKDYWTGKKGSYLGHLAFAGLGPIATVPDGLGAVRKLRSGSRNKRWKANVNKIASGASRHASVVGSTAQQTVRPLTTTFIGGTGFRRYV